MNELIESRGIFLDCDCADKEEVLEFIAAKAEEYGITDSRKALLQDLKDREAEFSTGLSDGFAIPHARTDNVKRVSVFFLRNRAPLEWETMDGKDVTSLFALLVPARNEGNIHLQMISALATSLMEDDFCNTVRECQDKEVLKSYILNTISPNNQ